MGNQVNCCSPDFQKSTTIKASAEMIEGDAISPSIEKINILDYERRVKMFATTENHGYVNVYQLKEAFKDTQIFQNILDRDNIESIFLRSTFVADFAVGSTIDTKQFLKNISLTKPSAGASLFGKSGTIVEKNSVVDDYLDQIELQSKMKKFALDGSFYWISINALILIGCLKCAGRDSQKADVFYRVVQPEMTTRVLVYDKDIRMSIFFLTNLATILEFMQKRMIWRSQERFDGRPDIDLYKRKMDEYEIVFDAVIEDFNNSMFGIYANSVTREDFKGKLMSDGWKYFDLNNLNQLFSIEYEKLVKAK